MAEAINPWRALTVEVGAAVFLAAGQRVPLEGAAQGPGLCVYHKSCSSSALQDLAKHSTMMHTMEFCAIVMEKVTTNKCLMAENMYTHLFNKYFLKTDDIPNTLLRAKCEKTKLQNSLDN